MTTAESLRAIVRESDAALGRKLLEIPPSIVLSLQEVRKLALDALHELRIEIRDAA